MSISQRQTCAVILAKSSTILREEWCWTRRAEARNHRGEKVDPLGDDAVQYCLQGAVFRACNGELGPIMATLGHLRNVLRSTGQSLELSEFNDDDATTHQDIVALLERAQRELNGASLGGVDDGDPIKPRRRLLDLAPEAQQEVLAA